MHRSERIRYVFLEAFLIAVGVLFALSAENWWANRQASQRATKAIAAIRQEMHRNAEALSKDLEFHNRLADTMWAVSKNVPQTREAALPLGTDLRPPDLSNGAWTAALSTGALEAAPDSVVTALAQVYAYQDYVMSFHQEVRVPLVEAMSEPAPTVRAINFIAFSLMSLRAFEERLLERLEGVSNQ